MTGLQSDITGSGGTMGSGGSTPIGSLSGTSGTPSAPANEDYYKTSLSRSEVEALILLLAAQFPILKAPSAEGAEEDNGVGSVSFEKGFAALQSKIMETQNKIISDMWDSYIKNIREQGDLAKEKARKDEIREADEKRASENRPMSGSEYMTFLIVASSTVRHDELGGSATENPIAVQFNAAYNDWLVRPAQQADPNDGSSNYPNRGFTVGVVVGNPDNVQATVGSIDPTGVKQMSVSPVADALVAIGPVSSLPADYQAAAALVAALLNSGAMQKANQNTLEEAARKGQEPRDVEFAINYAKNILAIVTHNVEGGNPLADDRNKMIKLMLATMGLNLLYRGVYQGMDAKEFIGLLNGDKIKDDLPQEVINLFEALAKEINQLLPDKGDPARDALLAQLGEYVDSKDSIDSMLDTTRLFVSVLKGSNANYRNLAV